MSLLSEPLPHYRRGSQPPGCRARASPGRPRLALRRAGECGYDERGAHLTRFRRDGITLDDRANDKWLVLGVVGVGTFMSALDGNVVNIAMPLIQRDYGASLGDVTWVVTAYLLTISSLLLIFGRLGDMWGYRRVYSAGYGIFGLGSLLCGLAGSLGGLVAARAVQGVGAAMLMSMSPALITTSFPASERGRALGLQATLTYTGLTVGPTLGGWIAGRFGWPWVFLVNVPVATVGGALALTLLRRGPGRGPQRFDLPGAALFGAGLTAALLALSQAEAWGWGSPAVIVLLSAGVVLLALFVRWEGRAAEPLMPLRLFRNQALAGGVVAAFLQYTVIFMAGFLLPFYLQEHRGFTPGEAGLILTAQPAVMVIAAAASGWLSDRLDPRGPATAGMAILAASAWLIGAAPVAAGRSALMARLALLGLGSGLFTTPNNSIIMGAAPRARQGVAAGLLAAARNVGMVTGVAVAGTLFAFLQAQSLARGIAADVAFRHSFHTTLFVAALLAAAGGVLSLLRPVREPVPGASAQGGPGVSPGG